MTAGHKGATGAGHGEGAGEYGGMDALMAAITGEPLPEEAGRDTAFLAEHRAAQADVALLRDQLTWLAQTLTGEALPGAEAGERGEQKAVEQGAVEQRVEEHEAEARGAEGREAEGRGAEGAEGRGAGGSAGAGEAAAGAGKSGSAPARPRSLTRPVGPARPARPPRPGRPSGPRRALRIALGSLAAGAACGAALGFGWLITQSTGDSAMSGGADSAKGAARGAVAVPEDAGRPAAPGPALACYRLVVEGTVAKVEPQPESPWNRIVLTVRRSYEPAQAPAEVTFLLDKGAKPAPDRGQHVLVGVGKGREDAGLWAVGDARVAVNRAWITEALPGAGRTACPSEKEPAGTP